MADEAEDVLELETFDEVDEQEAEAAEPEADLEGDEPDDEQETFVGFDGEEEDEAAPASESESSVIREMRRKLREQERELKNLREGQQPAKIELGPKPTLESCEYDEERFEIELDAWKAKEAKQREQSRQQAEAEQRQEAEWQETVKSYKAATAQLGVAGYEDAEAEVFSVLPDAVQALILRQKATAPALVYALSRSPSKLEELSKLNLADAAVMVGELKAKVKVEKRTKLPAPDRPVNGRAATPSAGKLDKMRDQARKTGNWDAYFAAKRASS